MSEEEGRRRAGELIKAFRVWRGLTPGKVASNAGIDVKTVRSLENGTRWAQELSRTKIEFVLGIQHGIIKELAEDPSRRQLLWDYIKSNPPEHQTNVKWRDEDELDVQSPTTDSGPVVIRPDGAALTVQSGTPQVTVRADRAQLLLELAIEADEVDGSASSINTSVEDMEDAEQLASDVDSLLVDVDRLTQRIHDEALKAVGGSLDTLRKLKGDLIAKRRAQRLGHRRSIAAGAPLDIERTWEPARKLVTAIHSKVRGRLAADVQIEYDSALLKLGTRDEVEDFMAAAVVAAGDSGFEQEVFAVMRDQAPPELQIAARELAAAFHAAGEPDELNDDDDQSEPGNRRQA